MKVFLKWFAVPLAIAVIASLLFIFDSLVAPQIFENAHFMWVAFAVWTLFYGASLKDRIKGLIGIVIGFLAGTLMFLITSSFTINVFTISISGLVGVLIVNFAVMFLDKAEKVWLNSLSGVFAGIFLTFSGLGVSLSPITSTENFFIMFGLIVLYSVLGLICGFFSILVTNKSKEKIQALETENHAIYSSESESKTEKE